MVTQSAAVAAPSCAQSAEDQAGLTHTSNQPDAALHVPGRKTVMLPAHV
jgi:hypothetical protein